jgi:pyridoxal biosynthesis lyase PdxS
METATFAVKVGLAQMLKGGVIMDVVDEHQARIAEEAGAVAGAPSRPRRVAAARAAPRRAVWARAAARELRVSRRTRAPRG